MKNRYVLASDVLLIALAAFAAFTARFDFMFFQHRPEFVPYLVAALVIKPPVLMFFGLYRRYWQYTTIQDVAAILGAVGVTSALMALFVMLRLGRLFFRFSRVVVLSDGALTWRFLAGLRVVIRAVRESAHRRATAKGIVNRRVLVAGAG